MSVNHKLPTGPITSVLIVGCGLIGTSLAMAWREAFPHMQIDGVDTNPHHRHIASETKAFGNVFHSAPDSTYDLGVIAIPVDRVETVWPGMVDRATWWMDVCSVKEPIVNLAVACGLAERFAPTHPMAGLAAGGPQHATSSLFRGQPWILLDAWPACDVVRPFICAIGAHARSLPSAALHDQAVAAASHVVHLTSVATMLSFASLCESDETWMRLTGPGFRDTTRLSGSPPGFWPATLMANRTAVLNALDTCKGHLNAFRVALEQEDESRLHFMLSEARHAREKWEEAQSWKSPERP